MEVIAKIHPIDFNQVDFYALGKAYWICTVSVDIFRNEMFVERLERGEEIRMNIMEVC